LTEEITDKYKSRSIVLGFDNIDFALSAINFYSAVFPRG